MRELNEIAALRAALEDARNYTLQVYSHLTPEQRLFPKVRTVNPPAWELAHIGWFQEFWCLRFRDGQPPRPARLGDADAMLNSAIIAHEHRWQLPELTWDTVIGYLQRVLEDASAALCDTAAGQRYFYQLALFHEDMHGEALLMALQTLGLPEPRFHRPEPAPLESTSSTVGTEVEFAGGSFEMGCVTGPDFAFDNERPAHRVSVAPFALASTQVSNAEYLRFVESGGYDREQLWTAAGRRWRNDTQARAPRYWRRAQAQWLVRRFDQWEPLTPDEPVMHVNAFEAEAYCKFVGKRLPTEAEWEYAARSGAAAGEDRFPWGETPGNSHAANLDGMYGRPVNVTALAASATPAGAYQLLGNVWEWTATEFSGYPGFVPGYYKEYSEPWFGDHRVLRGGCFATRSRLVHNRFRNFYTPDRGDIFAGFRTARSLSKR